MKKFSLLLLVLLACVSCEENVEFSTPGIQGQLDNVTWRAIDVRGTINEAGRVTITGRVRDQLLELKIPSKNNGTYVLGNNINRVANYTITIGQNELFYTTGVNIGGVGEVKVTAFDAETNTITGTFRFNAVNVNNNPLGGEFLNFQYGNFFKVPLLPVE
jgi:hypothetical protein